MQKILDNIINAVNAAGVSCQREYCRINGYDRVEKKPSAYAGIRRISFEKLHGGAADVSVQVRVTVQAFGLDGNAVQGCGEKIILPAVMNCGEEIFGAEISEVQYEVKTDRVYCEIFFDVKRCGYGICG
ncbi:MAG: hypothetical protein IJ035_08000 [Oscillospiraceae bacterium]|nr:hypothetical protein [Oscillospiraceae bacterium]